MDTKYSSQYEEESEEFSQAGLRRLLLLVDALLLAAFLACTVVFFIRLANRAAGSGSVPSDSLGASASAGEYVQNADPESGTGTAEADPGSSQQAVSVPAVTLAETSGARGNVNVASLQQQGESIVGWIYCPGTSIDYPIVQGEDNEYYMEHNRAGKKDSAGAIYLDCRNDRSFSDEQIMIYGNLMSDGSMFSPLVQYLNQAFYEQHPVFEFFTAAGKYSLSVYSVHRGSPAMSNYPIWFMDAASREAFIAGERASSAIQSSVQVQETDQLISLVTSSDFDAEEDARVIVRCVLRPVS